jgi:hypothetical protein
MAKRRDVLMADNVVRMPSGRWIDQLVESGYLDPAYRRSAAAIKAATHRMRAHSKQWRLQQVEPDDDDPEVA